MMKTFNKLVLGAAMLGASAASFAATPLPFTVDNGTSTFVATEISGVYNEVIQVTGPGTFDATVLLDFTSFINEGNALRGTGLSANYGLYAVVDFSGNVTSGAPTFATGGWAGSINMFLDPLFDTPSNEVASLVGINNVDFGGTDVDDSLLFSAAIDFGQSNGTVASSSFSLEATLEEDATTLGPLTTAGSAFFVAPDPFYDMLISFGLLNDFFGTIDFTSLELQRFNSSANVNFVKVSEPSVIGLLGLGLVFLTLRSRKSK